MNPRSFRGILIAALLMLAIGILLTAFPSIMVTACYIIGGILCAAAIVLFLLHFLKKPEDTIWMKQGTTLLIVGILFVLLPGLLHFLMPVVFGLWLLITSVSGILRNFALRQSHRTWWVGALLCFIGSILSLFILFRPAQVMDETVRIVGIVMIIVSVLRIVSTIIARQYYTEAPTGDVIDVTPNKD